MMFDGPVATLALDVAEDDGLFPGYELKLNSYDLGVDIELYDAVQRLRFEHPEARSVIITSGKERVFCAGANIRALAQASHSFKVNFCKFTNETRIAIEDATKSSEQIYLTAINGSCAGGGYELALATEYIVMADDGATSVSLPEIPLLAVLPGTGGLTRLVDKRRVRRDHADFFCTTEEGVRGARAVEWGLVDEVVPRTRLNAAARAKALEFAAVSARPHDATGITLAPLERTTEPDRLRYAHLEVAIDRGLNAATFIIKGPAAAPPRTLGESHLQGAAFWPLALASELDDAILHLRFNEESIGTWVFRSAGKGELVRSYDSFLLEHQENWLIREVMLYLKRTFARLEVTSRSIFALVEPRSCFHGTLLELAIAADRVYMLNGLLEGDESIATLAMTELNFGAYPMINGMTRLASRCGGDAARLKKLRSRCGAPLDAAEAAAFGLATFTPDDLDWDEEIRLALEARKSFSPDALTGMEASLRFAGPETMESKIFARLSAWQNWIFQRPNAVGEEGALKLYGAGRQPVFDPKRV